MSMDKNCPTILTQAQLKAEFDYDVKNGWLIRKTFRNGCPYNKPSGNKPTCLGYGQIRINKKRYLTHRLIWLWHKGQFPTKFIDHIDRNPMNNRIENLREADHSINGHNQKILKNNSSGFPGVCWDTGRGRYMVKIKINNKTKFIGRYNSYEEAVLAAKLAKIQYHPTSPDAKKYAEELGIEIS